MMASGYTCVSVKSVQLLIPARVYGQGMVLLPGNNAPFLQMQRIRQDDHGFFYKFFRKAPQLLDKLLSFLAEDLTRQHHIRETPGAWRTTCCSIEVGKGQLPLE